MSDTFKPIAVAETPLVRPRAILFDWDNTLVDTWPVIHASLADVFQAMGHAPWSLQQVRDNVRHSLRDSFPTLFGARWEEARDIFYDAFERRHLEALVALPGADALLDAFAGEGLALGVVSNKTGRYLRREADHLGWRAHFRALVGAGDAPRDKPSAEAVHKALADMAIAEPPAPETVWFVGDSNVDMEIAHATGCLPVLVRPDAGPAGEFDRHPPRLHLPDCAALHDLVLRCERTI